MIHFKPSALFRVRVAASQHVAPTPILCTSSRADHARMLSHAAKRRMAASGDEGAYWKACAPVAIARAAAIRGDIGFARLP